MQTLQWFHADKDNYKQSSNIYNSFELKDTSLSALFYFNYKLNA